MPHSDELDFDLDNRLIGAGYAAEDDGIELSLRPRTLDEYIGQDKVKENLRVFMESRSTMCCSTALPDWERPRWPTSSQTRWGATCG